MGGVVDPGEVVHEGRLLGEFLFFLRQGAHVLDEALGLARRQVRATRRRESLVGVVVVVRDLLAAGHEHLDARRLHEGLPLLVLTVVTTVVTTVVAVVAARLVSPTSTIATTVAVAVVLVVFVFHDLG